MKGRIFSIEEFSVFDGPGIRTSVFLKGCPLRCTWCHNPEGQSCEKQIIRSPNGCLNCGSCTKYAVSHKDGLKFTDESIKNCPMGLLRECSEDIEHDALCERLLKNGAILNRGGGVTFSGGEPTLQSKFLVACLSYLSGKLHTAVQTCGYCSTDGFKDILELADYFLYDLKLFDNEKHKKYTGVPNFKIKENYKALAASGKDFITRIPLIPTVTDTEENIEAIAAFMYSLGVDHVELLPYNKLAGGKYKSLGREYLPSFDETVKPNPREYIFESFSIKTKIL